MQRALLCCCLLPLASISVSAPPPERVTAADIHPERELLITDRAVVDSPLAQYPNQWSFGALMEELFGEDEAPEAVLRWLLCYDFDSKVGRIPLLGEPVDAQGLPIAKWVQWGAPALDNTESAQNNRGEPDWPSDIPRRPQMRQFIEAWQARDGYDPCYGPWRPNMANAPFRLLAIVNRMDLGAALLVDAQNDAHSQRERTAARAQKAVEAKLAKDHMSIVVEPDPEPAVPMPSGYGGGRFMMPQVAKAKKKEEPMDFGEGRLVFGAVDSEGKPLEGGWTVILEYKLKPVHRPVPGQGERVVAAENWAAAWHWLGTMPVSDPQYVASLARLTKVFTHRPRNEKGEISSTRPSLGQLRSSEGVFGPGREFRQFDYRNGALVPALLPMTPAPAFMDASRRDDERFIGTFLNDLEPLILTGMHSLPKKVESRKAIFLVPGATAVIPDGEKDFHWEPIPRLTREARRLFSMNTCNGCHAGDTGCPDGMHVHPRADGAEAQLSSFLRRDGQPNAFPDPGWTNEAIRLTEMEDRAAILAAFLEPTDRRRVDSLERLLRERVRRTH